MTGRRMCAVTLMTTQMIVVAVRGRNMSLATRKAMRLG